MAGSKCVIVGGGMVAGYAAKQLVELGLKADELAILSADTAVPYERPPLSKSFLAGKDSEAAVRINPEEFYRDHGIEIRLGCRVTAVDPAHRRLSLAGGGEFPFEKLILATGSSPRKLTIPGADLGNVFYLRTLEDSKAIRQRAGGARRAVVIGGGFIGLEVAAVLAQKPVETTLVIQEDRVWKRLFTPEMSQFFENYFSARGVRLVKNAKLRQLQGSGVVKAVELANGSTIDCDLVVAGIGARPATDLLAGSGIEMADGVKVNEYLETNVPGIFAAGDIADYPDSIFQKRRRVEHWDNAVSQAQHCARALMGERTPFRHVPYFFSDVFDLSYEFWGDPTGAVQAVPRGDLASNSFSVWWVRNDTLAAAFVMNRPNEERDAAPLLIESGRRVQAAHFRDTARPIVATGAARG